MGGTGLPRPTAAGLVAFVLGATLIAVGEWLGWGEFLLIGFVIAGAPVIGLTAVVLPRPVSVTTRLRPARVFATDTATLDLEIRPKLLPMDRWVVQFHHDEEIHQHRMGRAWPGRTLATHIPILTRRRGVWTVGPYRHRLQDPWGFFTRTRTLAPASDITVWPRVVELDPIGQGLMRDLDGTVSSRVSPSDLNIHSMRPYEWGDDMRHVHWRASAHAGELLVKQYQDTLNSRIAVLIDPDAAAYGNADGVELAASVAGSIGLRAVADGFTVSLSAGHPPVVGEDAARLLDAIAGFDFAEVNEGVRAASFHRAARGAGSVVLITGDRKAEDVAEAMLATLPGEVQCILLSVGPDGGSSGWRGPRTTRIRLGTLEQLPALLRETAG